MGQNGLNGYHENADSKESKDFLLVRPHWQWKVQDILSKLLTVSIHVLPTHQLLNKMWTSYIKNQYLPVLQLQSLNSLYI